jgi:threonine dehydrogenase-like Zn-dependent dehydrogenase
MSCIVGAFRAQYHFPQGEYDHEMGIREGGNCALLAAAGPMGLGAIDFALHGPRQPGRLLVTDVDPQRLGRARRMFPPEQAARDGVELAYLNPRELQDRGAVDYVREFTGGEMMDDVFIFYPAEALVEQADAMLARNGCLNFFAGPSRRDFSARLNFYNVHYEAHHVVGTSGGNTEDMRIALRLMSDGKINPTGMVTHVGGLDSAPETILNLPDLPGGKKLIYTGVRMPLTALEELADRAEQSEEPLKSVFVELDRLVQGAGGVWCTEAERFLLSRDEIKLQPR